MHAELEGQWSHPVLTSSAPTRHSWFKVPRKLLWQTPCCLATCSLGNVQVLKQPWLVRAGEMDLTNHYTRFPTEPLQPISVVRNSLDLRCVHVCVFSCVRLFVIPWTIARQASLSMEFSRQEYWSGLPFPTPRDLPHPGIEPGSPALPVDYYFFF